MAEPFFVTTPIYYVNDVPHIGHAYPTVAADVLARWRRMHGDDVLFLTGTDEHGLKVQRSAEQHGVSPIEWADRTSQRYRDTWAALDISYDDFIRTTEPRHHTAVQEFLQRIYDRGDIELGTYEGQYCVPCEAYYTDDELVDGNCPIHKRPVDHVVEENYFFRLSRYEQRLLDYYEQHPDAVQPESRRNEVIGFIKGGLRDFSMSRTSISWGVPVPWDDRHVTYVWFDALINYCTAAGLGSDPEKFSRFWPADVHVIGKDILRFHAVFWPAMLMAAELELPKRIFAHGWLLVGGEKMSKTTANQIAPEELIAEFGVDGFRYHFMADQRFGPDGDFSFESMVARYNADLANNYGNLANRVLNMASNYCAGSVPANRANGPLVAAAETAVAVTTECMLALDYSGALNATWELMRATNAYIEATAPWKLNKAGDDEACSGVLGDCLEALRIATLLAAPTIPRATASLWKRLGFVDTPSDRSLPDALSWGQLPAGNMLTKGDPLFPRKEVKDTENVG